MATTLQMVLISAPILAVGLGIFGCKACQPVDESLKNQCNFYQHTTLSPKKQKEAGATIKLFELLFFRIVRHFLEFFFAPPCHFAIHSIKFCCSALSLSLHLNLLFLSSFVSISLCFLASRFKLPFISYIVQRSLPCSTDASAIICLQSFHVCHHPPVFNLGCVFASMAR